MPATTNSPADDNKQPWTKSKKTKIWDLWDVNNRCRLGREVKVCRNTSDNFLVLFLFFLFTSRLLSGHKAISGNCAASTGSHNFKNLSFWPQCLEKGPMKPQRRGESFNFSFFLTSLPWGQDQLLNCTAATEAEVSKTPRENPSLWIKGPGKWASLLQRVLIIFVIAFFSLFSCCFSLKQACSHWTVDLCRWLQLWENSIFQPEEQPWECGEFTKLEKWIP